MHKRDYPVESSQQASAADDDTDVIDTNVQVDRAPEKASEAIVQRVSYGLVRLESQRKARVFLRRLAYVILVAGVAGGLWHFFGHLIPLDHLREQWDQIYDKLFPDYSASGSSPAKT